jgi:hypothetical protein
VMLPFHKFHATSTYKFTAHINSLKVQNVCPKKVKVKGTVIPVL